MKTVALMQPYLWPYLGYFQLIHAVDTFVFYDDVNFIKSGWINRNRLLLGGEVRYLTVPLSQASPFKKICEVQVALPQAQWRRKLADTVRHGYAKAPCFEAVYPLVTAVLNHPAEHIADLAKASVTSVADYLGLTTEFVPGSARYGNAQLSGAQRVKDICRQERADTYLNMLGGQTLYDRDDFLAAGLTLRFLAAALPPYPQTGVGTFEPGLSILDVLMHTPRETVRAMLDAGTLQ